MAPIRQATTDRSTSPTSAAAQIARLCRDHTARCYARLRRERRRAGTDDPRHPISSSQRHQCWSAGPGRNYVITALVADASRTSRHAHDEGVGSNWPFGQQDSTSPASAPRGPSAVTVPSPRTSPAGSDTRESNANLVSANTQELTSQGLQSLTHPMIMLIAMPSMNPIRGSGPTRDLLGFVGDSGSSTNSCAAATLTAIVTH